MKVIFLDIDGVLNTSQTFIEIDNEFIKTGKRRIEIDLDRVERLKEIVNVTGAVIVLSSSWRSYGEMKNGEYVACSDKMAALIELFDAYGLKIYDVTPVDDDGIRQNEIYAWLKDKEIDSFIIFDDDSYSLQDFLHKELIKTSITGDKEMIMDMDDCIGICQGHVEEAIKKLIKNDMKER